MSWKNPTISTAPQTDNSGLVRPWERDRSFTLELLPVDAALAGAVERHWSVRWDRRGCEPFVQETLPHPSINLVVEPGGAWIYGVPTTRNTRALTGLGWAIGAKFEPGAFTGLTGIEAASLTDSRISAAEAFAAHGGVGAIPDGGDPAATAAAIEALLLPLVPIADPMVESVGAVMRSMREAPATVRVEDIAAARHLAPRTLQKLFRRYVGVGPKWVLKRLRIHRAAEILNGPEPPPWTELALDLGYYDQAHFGNEFRDVVGRSPSAYAAEVTAGRFSNPEGQTRETEAQRSTCMRRG